MSSCLSKSKKWSRAKQASTGGACARRDVRQIKQVECVRRVKQVKQVERAPGSTAARCIMRRRQTAAHLRRVYTALLAQANGGKVGRLQRRPVCHPLPRTVNVPQRLRQKHLIANRQGMRIKQHVAVQGMHDLARRLLQRRSLRQPLLLTRGQVERRLHARHATRHRTKAAQNKGGTEQRRRLEPALRTAMRRRLLWRAADAEARAT